MEWNDRLETEYMRYAGGKWDKFGARGGWRTRADWLAARQKWQKSRDVGDRFRDGMSAIRGHTPERGYHKEVHLPTNDGSRFHDVRNDASKRAFEYKSGAIDKKALVQLDKDAQFMAREGSVEWIIVEGARIDKEVRDRLLQMRKEFPNQFRVVQVTREQLRQSLTVAKHLEKVRDREARQQKKEAREKAEQLRQQQAPRELARRRDELARIVNENAKKIEQAREADRPYTARELTETFKDVRAEKRSIERADKQQAKKLVNDLKLTPQQQVEMQAYLAERREQNREKTGVTRGLEEIGAAAREAEAREKAAAQEQQRARERERVVLQERARAREAREKAGLAPEIGNILDAGNPLPSQQVRDGRSDHRLSGAREQEGRGRDLYRGRN